MAKVRLSVIYANHNTTDLLVRSIGSLQAHGGGVALEVIVADDGSSESPAAGLAAFAGVRLTHSVQNRGFGAANNLGAREATGDYLLLLNTDAFVTEESRLAAILDYLDAHPGVGALLPQLVNQRGQVQPTQIAHDPSAWRVIADKPVKLLMRIPGLRSLLRPLASVVNLDFAALDRGRTVPVAVAAALFVRRDVFVDIGGFDESYFMYFEDSDLCRRIRQAGKAVEYHPEWRVVHLHGSSIASDRNRKRLYFESQRRYFDKHGAAVDRWLIAVLQPFYMAAQRVLQKT